MFISPYDDLSHTVRRSLLFSVGFDTGAGLLLLWKGMTMTLRKLTLSAFALLLLLTASAYDAGVLQAQDQNDTEETAATPKTNENYANAEEGATYMNKRFMDVRMSRDMKLVPALLEEFDAYYTAFGDKPESVRAAAQRMRALIVFQEKDKAVAFADATFKKFPEETPGMADMRYFLGALLVEDKERHEEGIGHLKAASEQAGEEWARMAEAAYLKQNNISHALNGKPCPALNFEEFNTGAAVSLEALRGKVVVLDFWGTWCGPCKKEIPALKGIYEDFKDKDFVMIGIAFESGDNAKDKLQTTLKEEGVEWMQYLTTDKDIQSDLRERFKVPGYPTILVIGADGTVVAGGVRGQGTRKAVEKAFELKAASETPAKKPEKGC